MPTYKHSNLPNTYFFYGNDEEFRNVIVKIWYWSKKDTYLFDYSFPKNVNTNLPTEIKVIKSIPTGNRIWGLNRSSICFVNFLPMKQFMNVISERFHPLCLSVYRIDLPNFLLLLRKQKLKVQVNKKLEFFQSYN